MKSLISIIVLVLCFHGSMSGSAKEELTSCTKRFVTDFIERLEGANKVLRQSRQTVAQLFEAEESLLLGKYATKVAGAQSAVKSFVETFNDAYKNLSYHFDKISEDFGDLVYLAEKFQRCGQFVYRMKQSTFPSNVASSALQVISLNNKIKSLADQTKLEIEQANKLVQEFSKNPRLNESTDSEQAFLELKTAINGFIVELNNIQWTGFLPKSDIQNLFNSVLRLVSVFEEYASNK